MSKLGFFFFLDLVKNGTQGGPFLGRPAPGHSHGARTLPSVTRKRATSNPTKQQEPDPVHQPGSWLSRHIKKTPSITCTTVQGTQERTRTCSTTIVDYSIILRHPAFALGCTTREAGAGEGALGGDVPMSQGREQAALARQEQSCGVGARGQKKKEAGWEGRSPARLAKA